MLEIIKNPSKSLNEKLMNITGSNELKCLSVFKSCNTSICSSQSSDIEEEAKPLKSLNIGMMLVTNEAIHLVTNFRWLCEDNSLINDEILTQPMTNLVELDNLTNSSFTLNFMDELENTIEKWRFTFESYSRIVKTLEIIDEIWKQIFSLSLLPDEIYS